MKATVKSYPQKFISYQQTKVTFTQVFHIDGVNMLITLLDMVTMYIVVWNGLNEAQSIRGEDKDPG